MAISQMGDNMRNIIVLLIAAMLIFGCAVPGGSKTGTQGTGGTGATQGGQGGTQGTQPAEECTPSQTFSELEAGLLSKTTELTATVTCAAGKSLVVKVDGEPVVTQTVPSNATQEIKLGIPAEKDGKHTVTVELGGESLLSKEWSVKPLGMQEIKGLETDAVSFKEWRAVAVDVENAISAARVKAYLKTQQFRTQPNSHLLLEVRKDKGGEPGDIVTSVRKPISVVTQSDNWINFDFDPALELQPGRYWLVLKIEQTEEVNLVSDLVQLHYVVVDKTASGNEHNKQMLLSVDTKTGMASESQWTPLTYDREYNIVLTTSK
jgi:hypothetical protein